ncbi:MFS transporter, DHA1 family, arabinose polymer transporter [Streptoalloteichus tenebrarius]|uniref:MFS transporter, DHA1 family, arabinose polymer transporter n=1 Tax=Streptoalloteichus tenebrarius (strain ATCC 17920 / DSM 40477 / JCM 4838 / CBS 697.72 / NBRC 16177 / NCIMB 11028 / NRRL B-12390 / A12253. 1 / ISP 5477) TaxID=1933 RepID=A0ABT1HLZ1_STRSD|nr:MFS transporter [Streptoalloteichus tenebrarius]MCP2256515.1 MFS transporter, DHA1 family, arabinose polymer transporter [Streptoalloteichus tenebrarius]BFF04866.1 MFS transporter [Streptoalloteichus tenebrarius]
MTSLSTPVSAARTHWRAHAAVLALGTFAVGTDAFVIAGVLPDIAGELDVSVGAAGQLVSVFSLAYALLAPVLSALTAHWSRRSVLVTALVVFAVGNAVTALAPGYALVLASRVVAAAGAALYTGNASATAATLAGDAHRGRAIALVILGSTSSLVLGAPLGTAIGSAWGWRSTMWFVTALALAATPFIALRLPEIARGPVVGLRQRMAPLADRGVLRALVTTVVAFVGIYMPYTYLSSIFEPATAGDGDRLAVLILLFGIAGTAGNLLAGHLADRVGPRRVSVAATALLTAVFLATPALRESFLVALPVVVVTGLFSFGVTTPQQHQIIARAPGAQSLVISLYQSALYLAVSLSSVLGAAALGLADAGWLPVFAAVFTLVAALTTWLDRRGESGS